MNELALFAGAGGGILGGMLLGWRTVAAVEIEDYPRRVLLQRQADGILPRFPVWDDVCTFDGKPWRGKVDVISGGFPCQDISAAGKGAGITGERSGLWSEFSRIIGEVQPAYVFVENSPLLVSRGLDTVLSDLAEMGYDAKWGIVGAHHAGAPHKRDRIWIVACNANSDGESVESVYDEASGVRPVANSGSGRRSEPRKGEVQQQGGAEAIRSGEDVPDSLRIERESGAGRRGIRESDSKLADTASLRQQGQREYEQPINTAEGQDREADRAINSSEARLSWWITEPDVGRVAHELAEKLDKP